MTVIEKEELIEKYGYPIAELIAMKRWSRDEALKDPGIDDIRAKELNAEYEQALDRAFDFVTIGRGAS